MTQRARRRSACLNSTTLLHTTQYRNAALEGRSLSSRLTGKINYALANILVVAGACGDVGLGHVAVVEPCADGLGAGFDLAGGGVDVVVLRGESDA